MKILITVAILFFGLTGVALASSINPPVGCLFPIYYRDNPDSGQLYVICGTKITYSLYDGSIHATNVPYSQYFKYAPNSGLTGWNFLQQYDADTFFPGMSSVDSWVDYAGITFLTDTLAPAGGSVAQFKDQIITTPNFSWPPLSLNFHITSAMTKPADDIIVTALPAILWITGIMLAIPTLLALFWVLVVGRRR